MYHQQIRLSLAVSCAFLALNGLHSTSMDFHVAPGTSLTKTFESRAEVTLEGLNLVIDDNDIGAMLGDFEVQSEAWGKFTLNDTYHALEAGRVTKLTRRFEALRNATSVSFSSQFGAEAQEIPLKSRLEGKTLDFEWDPKEERYRIAFVDGKGADQKLLRNLEFETDMRFLLAPGEVEPGDSWDVPILQFKEMLMPCGDLVWMPEELPDFDMDAFEDIGEEVKDRAAKLIQEALKGKATCTFLGVQDQDGQKLGAIEIKLEFSLDLDLVPIVEEFLQTILEKLPIDLPMELHFDSLELSLSIVTEGTAYWAIEAGHFHSMHLESEADFSAELLLAAEVESESHSMEMSLDMLMLMSNDVQFGK